MSEKPREEKVLERRETLTMSKFSEFKENKNGDYSQHLVTRWSLEITREQG